MNSMLTSNPNMSVLALVFQNFVNCSQSGVFLLDHLVLTPLNVTYQKLLPLIVCDIYNKECMEHRCPNCPASKTLLQDFLFRTIGDFDDDVIEFS